MCGIFGYVGKRNGIPIALQGLKKIEYRGYDSAGIAFVSEEKKLHRIRSVGKIENLEQKISSEEKQDTNSYGCVIAHTRWATHGKVSIENAHPIFDQNQTVGVIHNGIIENFATIRNELVSEGVIFRTDTDTEVIPNLVAKFYEGDLLQAVQKVLQILKGAWALVIIHKDHPGECIVAVHCCPLVVGLGHNETYIASDPNALISLTKNVHFLHDGELARLTPDEVEFFDIHNTPISKEVEQLLYHTEEATKGEYSHYTLKEIFEQPQTIKNAMASRFIEMTGEAVLDDVFIKPSDLVGIKRIVIVACGTSYHAGMVASYMFEELARIPATVQISSEYRYKNPIVEEGTLAIAISQSGETADTIAAVRALKAKGAKIFGICNVQGSSLCRESDVIIFLRAGPEIGVCSTKAFTSQLVVLTLMALMMARLHHLSQNEAQEIIHALKDIPSQVQEVLDTQKTRLEALAEKYKQFSDFFFIGRKYMYPASLEGALKLKEIAYVNANGYAAGEIKHGPIALLSELCPVIALCADKSTYEKMVSNITEAKARLSPVIAISDHDDPHLKALVDDFILIPKTRDELAPILTSIVCQLFAYYSAALRGAEIDMPKNLAKSVTVE